MKISDKLAAHQTFSFEIFPPKGDLPLEKAFEIAGAMATCGPDWISVTYSAGGSGNSDNTVAIAGSIEEKLNTTALAHLTCMGSTAADVDAYVAALAADGVHDSLKDGLALFHTLIDAFTGRAANIETGNALVQKVFCKALHTRCADAAVFVIACIKRRENALIFFQLCVHVLFSFL